MGAAVGRVRAQWRMLVLLAVIGGTVVIPAGASEHLTPLQIFAVVVLAFLPGWMFIRFVTVRAQSVLDEYVLNLHRLGMDLPQHLPRPPRNSIYFDRWERAGGPRYEHERNLYRDKFDAYYGRSTTPEQGDGYRDKFDAYYGRSTAPDHGDGYRVKAETFFPVVLATAVFVAGWTVVLGKLDLTRVAPHELGAVATPDLMGVAFAGAYLFTLQMLIRRYFQADLKASAYVNAVTRVVSAVVLVPVVNAAVLPLASPEVRVGVAFLVGFFPLVGLQALQRAAALALRTLVPTLRNDYPLSDLDGLSVWYEARLLELGIEDMENLATANLVDVVLHSRVPVSRLVDWVDQAHLFLHLAPKSEDPTTRRTLRRLGVRTATALEDAVRPEGLARGLVSAEENQALVDDLRCALNRDGLTPSVTTSLLKTFESDPNLKHVRQWKRDWSQFREPAASPLVTAGNGKGPH